MRPVYLMAGTKLLGRVAGRELVLHGNPHLRRVHLGDLVYGRDLNSLPRNLFSCMCRLIYTLALFVGRRCMAFNISIFPEVPR